MNFLPIVIREMRVVSRRSWTFRTRMLFALAGLLVCFFLFAVDPDNPRIGNVLLWGLSIASIAFALLAGCFLSSDSLSSEKREGTLGLLYLSSLRSHDIIIGKMLSNSVHVAFALVAIFPVFFLPVLAGGVLWDEVVRILLATLITLLFSLSAGMLVSSIAYDVQKSVGFTFVIMVFFTGLPWLLYVGVVEATNTYHFQVLFPSSVFLLFAGRSDFISFAGSSPFWNSMITLAALSLLFLFAAGLTLSLRWKSFTSPVSQQPKNTKNRRTPIKAKELTSPSGLWTRNPYEWYCSRTSGESGWSNLFRALLVFFWLGALLVSWMTGDWADGFIVAMYTAFALHLITKCQLAFAATKHLNEDRCSGSLEILLTTPLPDRAIVEGQLEGTSRRHRGRFRTIILVNLAMILWMSVFHRPLRIGDEEWVIFATFLIGGILAARSDFKTLNYVAIKSALTRKTHIRAAMKTVLSVMLFPWILAAIFFVILVGSQGDYEVFLAMSVLWFSISLVFSYALRNGAKLRLQQRVREIAAGA